MEIHAHAEQHIEVHKFHAGVVTGAVILALVLEAFLLVHFRRATCLELPLLVTIYFALSRGIPHPVYCWAWSSASRRIA